MPANISKVKLGEKFIGPGEPIFLIAEIANCHNGDFDTAKRMVEVISGVGVDAVKFQLHIPEAEMTGDHPKFVTQGQRTLSITELRELKKQVESSGLYFLCTPFSREAADQLEKINCDVFKIGSGEMTDLPFIEYIAKKRKPMLVSTGMSTLEEIEDAVNLIRSYGTPFMLFHTISIYPPPYERLNLGMIPVLKERFGVPIGLSDHTYEIFSAIAAVPYGVSCIEKHYTLNRNQVGTSDHKVSLEPQEWRVLVDGVRKIEKACGSEKTIFPEERSVIEWARHSIVSVKDIPAGAIITADAISTKRPLFKGIPAKDLTKVIGKRVICHIPRDTRLTWGVLE